MTPVPEASGLGSAGWIRPAKDIAGCERIEAFFAGRAYEPHRHDTYAIGCTLAGVQNFQYRGGLQNGLPGTTMVLHPDEVHDGQAGTEAGFHYRMIYIEPALIQQVLGGRPLPFIEHGVSQDRYLLAATSALLRDLERPIEALEYDDAIYDLARALDGASSRQKRGGAGIIDYAAARRARDYINAMPSAIITLDQLEDASGQDRWRLSRDFRKAFGTSPYRYLVMRRLDRVKQILRSGESLMNAALDAGFSDQAHMTRHFRRTFGVTPASWRALLTP
jgi:AraC-like DNA-binding protein